MLSFEQQRLCADVRSHVSACCASRRCAALRCAARAAHSFMKGHSARAARARTSVTWITTRTVVQPSRFKRCCFSCRLRLTCCARGSTFPFFFVLFYLLVYVSAFVVFCVSLAWAPTAVPILLYGIWLAYISVEPHNRVVNTASLLQVVLTNFLTTGECCLLVEVDSARTRRESRG